MKNFKSFFYVSIFLFCSCSPSSKSSEGHEVKGNLEQYCSFQSPKRLKELEGKVYLTRWVPFWNVFDKNAQVSVIRPLRWDVLEKIARQLGAKEDMIEFLSEKYYPLSLILHSPGFREVLKKRRIPLIKRSFKHGSLIREKRRVDFIEVAPFGRIAKIVRGSGVDEEFENFFIEGLDSWTFSPIQFQELVPGRRLMFICGKKNAKFTKRIKFLLFSEGVFFKGKGTSGGRIVPTGYGPGWRKPLVLSYLYSVATPWWLPALPKKEDYRPIWKG